MPLVPRVPVDLRVREGRTVYQDPQEKKVDRVQQAETELTEKRALQVTLVRPAHQVSQVPAGHRVSVEAQECQGLKDTQACQESRATKGLPGLRGHQVSGAREDRLGHQGRRARGESWVLQVHKARLAYQEKGEPQVTVDYLAPWVTQVRQGSSEKLDPAGSGDQRDLLAAPDEPVHQVQLATGEHQGLAEEMVEKEDPARLVHQVTMDGQVRAVHQEFKDHRVW